MKIKDSTITFWFQKQSNPKIYVDKFNEILKEHFFDFSIIGVPANITPVIPRLTAVSSSNHSRIEISLINAKLTTNFDDNYSENFSMCLDYLKERTFKLFEALRSCNINIIYSAIFINLEEKEDNAVKKIKEQFLKVEDLERIDEIGVRFSQIKSNKFYQNISFSNSKQVKVEKIFEDDQGNIILPLISLNDASEVENYLSVSLETNDKFSFNLDSNYNTNKQELQELFELTTERLQEEMKRFIK